MAISSFRILLLFSAATTLLSQPGFTQPSLSTAALRYRDSEKVFKSHSSAWYQHDDSQPAIKALQDVWAALKDAAVEALAANRDAGVSELSSALCSLWSTSGGCQGQSQTVDVVVLGSRLFLVSASGDIGAGTVFIVGFVGGKPSILWSLRNMAAQTGDPNGLLSAWNAERSGEACRTDSWGSKPGTCGPLIARGAGLPPDTQGRPRFYLDAEYIHAAGTFARQISIWTWNGGTAQLEWIENYEAGADQTFAAEFANGILTIEEKKLFRSFFACGMCDGRQVSHRLRVTPAKMQDLGTISHTPELDLIDELLWRLANGRTTRDIASDRVSRLVKPLVLKAKLASKAIGPGYFSTGMLMDVTIRDSGNLRSVCFTVDSELNRLYFTIRHAGRNDARIVNVVHPLTVHEECAESSERKRKRPAIKGKAL